jgi:gliding motility-associated-like protein
MRNRRFLLFLFTHSLLLCNYLTAQNGIWTWISGSPVGNPPANYGAQGVPFPSNTPPGLYECAEWTDLNGNFWIHGGLTSQAATIENCLWKYDPATGIWTWMKGASTAGSAGVYGVQGVPSPANYPSGRSYAPISWTDANGDFWLYGGVGFDINGTQGNLQDLWRYTVATNEWTWMAGPDTVDGLPNHGTILVPAITNVPHGTQESASNWVDATGKLWMYCGTWADDMWMYDPATNLWTWMSGQNVSPVPTNFGTLGVTSPTNTPGNRWVFNKWTDQQGNFWIYSGFQDNGFAGDMWMYNPNTLLWTWMAGDSSYVPNLLDVVGNLGTFSQQCVPGSNHPPVALEDRACWTDACGRFWSASGANYLGLFNTMWFFDPQTLQFTWVTGSLTPNDPGNFGLQNVPAPTNIPPGLGGKHAFKTANGDLWMFGGTNVNGDCYNTFWRYQIDPFCPGLPPVADFVSSPQPLGCAPLTLQFIPDTTGVIGYSWNFGDLSTTADTSITQIPSWTFTQPGTYTVTLTVDGITNCPIVNNINTDTLVITVIAAPQPDLGNDTILCASFTPLTLNAGNTATNYLWNTGDTTQQITAIFPGTYSVILSNGPGNICSSQDSISLFLIAAPVQLTDTILCSNLPLTLSVNAPVNVIWNTGDTALTIPVTSSGNYSYTYSIFNCQFSDTASVTFIPLPQVNLGADTIICSSVINLVLNAANTGTSYAWSTGDTTSSILTLATGVYSVTVTAQANCIDTDTITISQAPTLQLNNDTSFCNGQSITISANIPGTYSWNTGDTAAAIQINTGGIYILQVTNATCVSYDTVLVTVLPLPVVNLGNDTLLCPNQTLVLSAANSNASYNWNTGSSSATISINEAGSYSVIVNQAGCIATDSIRVTYTTAPQLGNDLSLCLIENNLVLDAGNISGSYNWSTGDTTSSITISESGIYFLTVTNGNCVLTDSITITGNPGGSLLYVPNSFTPNGDGLNDNFKPVGTDITSFNLLIFNRWGELIFETNDYNQGWNGFTNNQQAETEVYVYLIDYSSSCSADLTLRKMGHVSVIR